MVIIIPSVMDLSVHFRDVICIFLPDFVVVILFSGRDFWTIMYLNVRDILTQTLYYPRDLNVEGFPNCNPLWCLGIFMYNMFL